MEAMVSAYQDKLMSVMPLVRLYKSRLEGLYDWWGKITLIGKINSYNLASTILDDMECTKEKFGELHNKLINNLLLEHLQKLIVDQTSTSQVAIDILIRNLFERTADVGFLATDDDIRDFLIQRRDKGEAQDLSERQFIEERLSEYVKKYSVYDEIIVLDPQGEVCVHLDQNNPISYSNDPLIKATLTSSSEYTETFRHSDLQPRLEHSLIYSCKITESNDPASPVLGVLCLCFRFDDELKGIFSHLLAQSKTVLLILNKEGQVIASSNPRSVALQSRFKFNASPQLVSHQNKEYIVSTTQTNGYQGFFGLGWWSQVMTPVESAFAHSGDLGNYLDRSEVASSSRLFSQALKEIYKASIDVNDDLSLVVLNGKITAVRQEAAEFMPVLEEIKQIGENTANIFSDSIKNMQATVVSSRMNDVQFMAALAVDIMDRNLYERANDCRWWALTTAFRRILAQGSISSDEQAHISAILTYINNLYTVYTNLYLYDKNQKIIAVSNESEKGFIGHQLSELSGSKEALTLSNSQHYRVSSFDKTPLYGERHTYIYNAAITRLDRDNSVVGGIGIVFDSEPQFDAMLTDTLPRNENGGVCECCFGIFAECSGRIISATANAPHKTGEQLKLDPGFFSMENGAKSAEIITYNNTPYIVGIAVSAGYREYKTTEDYDNDVIAFIFVPL